MFVNVENGVHGFHYKVTKAVMINVSIVVMRKVLMVVVMNKFMVMV